MANSTKLTNEQLETVYGGTETGTKKDGKVFINVPLIGAAFGLTSRYYSKQDVETLITLFSNFLDPIKANVDSYPDIANAVKSLYEGDTMPEALQYIFS